MEETLNLLERKRRWHGLILGLISGLLFGLLSQGVNYLPLSGISLYQPPLGPLGNTLMFTAIGGILGAITCWAGGSVYGVVIGSLVAGLMLIASALLTTNLNRNLGPKVAGLIGFYMPFAASVVPLLSLLRIAVNQQRDYYEYRLLSWKRLRLPLFLGLIMVALGMAFLFPPEGQRSVARMNQMIRTGLQAGDPRCPAPTPAGCARRTFFAGGDRQIYPGVGQPEPDPLPDPLCPARPMGTLGGGGAFFFRMEPGLPVHQPGYRAFLQGL